jgi:hypothetical protein
LHAQGDEQASWLGGGTEPAKSAVIYPFQTNNAV